jgi:hypothetical protein
VKGHEISPRYADLTVGLARTELSMGRKAEARNLILQALDRTPDNPDALLAAGIILARTGDRQAARRYLEHGVEVSPKLRGNARRACRAWWIFGSQRETSNPLMKLLSLALRIIVSLTCLLASLWALLAYVPFTYQQVHKGGLVPALNVFGRAFPGIFWILLLAVAVIFCLEPIPAKPRHRASMRLRAFFLVPFTCRSRFSSPSIRFSGPWKTELPVMHGRSSCSSRYCSLPAIAIWDNWPAIQWGGKPAYGEPRLFMTTCVSAVFLSFIYSGLANWRAAQSWTPLQTRARRHQQPSSSHLLVFAILFVALNLLTVVAGWFRNPQRTLFLFCHATQRLGGLLGDDDTGISFDFFR